MHFHYLIPLHRCRTLPKTRVIPMFLESGRGVLQRDGVFGWNNSSRNTPWEPAQRTRSGIADKLFDTHAPLYCVIIHTCDIPLLLLSTSLAFVSSQKQFNRAEGHPVFKAHRVSKAISWSWCEAAQSFGGNLPPAISHEL